MASEIAGMLEYLNTDLSVSYLLDLRVNVFLQWAKEGNAQLEQALLGGMLITAPRPDILCMAALSGTWFWPVFQRTP